MGLLETIINKFFPSLSDEEMAGIMLDMKACWEISKIKQKNCSAFFRTLNNLVPAGATLCFEGTSISKGAAPLATSSMSVPQPTTMSMAIGV